MYKNLKRLIIGNVILTVFLVLLLAGLTAYRLHALKGDIDQGFTVLDNKLVVIDAMVGKLYVAEIHKDKYINPALLPNRSSKKIGGPNGKAAER